MVFIIIECFFNLKITTFELIFYFELAFSFLCISFIQFFTDKLFYLRKSTFPGVSLYAPNFCLFDMHEFFTDYFNISNFVE